MRASEQERGEDIVGHEYEHAAHDHGRRGGVAHGFRPLAVASSVGVVALEAADGDDDDGKDHGLEEAALHVVHGDARLYARAARRPKDSLRICPRR